MRTVNEPAMRPSRVTALYTDSARSFRLPEGATFSDLAERLGEIQARSGRMPVAIDVKFDA